MLLILRGGKNLLSRRHDGTECEGRLGHAVGHLHLVWHDLALGHRVVAARSAHHLHLDEHRLPSLRARDVRVRHRDRRHLQTLLGSCGLLLHHGAADRKLLLWLLLLLGWRKVEVVAVPLLVLRPVLEWSTVCEPLN